MRSGKLSRAVTIQRATATEINAAGTPAPTWSDLAMLRAELVGQAATETIRQLGAAEEEVLVFRTRYLAGVTTADRLLFEGGAYNLKSVGVLGRNRGLELRAVAVR